MVENTSVTILIYRVDEASVSKSEKRLKDLEKENKKLEKSLDKTGDVSKSVAKELEKIGRQSKIDNVVKEAKALEKQTKDSDAAVKQLTADLQKLGATDDEVRGAVQAFSNQGSGAFKKGLLGEVGTQVRNAPAIPIPGTGITTEPISKAAIALDRMGVSIGQLGAAAPIAAVGIAILAIGIGKFIEDAKKQAESLNSIVEARRKVGQDVAGGLGTEDAASRQEELARLREQEVALLEKLKAEYEKNITSQNDIFESVLRLTPQEEELANQISASESAIASYNTEEKALTQAREDGTLAANDAASEEKRLAEERVKAILESGQQAAELEQARQDVEGKTRLEIQALIEAEQDRERVLRAELEALRASGDTSDEVTQRIAQLESQLSTSAEKVDVFNDALRRTAEAAQSVAQEAQNAASLEQARQQVLGATSEQIQSLIQGEQSRVAVLQAELSVLQASGDTTRQTTERIAQLKNELGLASQKADIFRKALSSAPSKTERESTTSRSPIKRASSAIRSGANDLEKAAKDYQKKLVDVNRDLVITFNDIGQDLFDNLQDLNIDTKRDIRDALAEGDFLGIRDIQRDAVDKRADIERDAARDRRDAQIEANRDLLQLQQEFLQAQIAQMQTAINQASNPLRARSFASIQAPRFPAIFSTVPKG